ncbi:MAG: hypothetical protein IKG40_02535 [Bacilli bacterium]|nr:hypothetical protein [Bacilli bacterium]
MRKILFFILFLAILVLSILFYNDYRIKHAVIKVKTIDNLDIEVYSKIKLSDLVKSINGKFISNKTIDTSKIGKQKIKFKYINEDNIKVKYSFFINIVDTTAPVISEVNVINVYEGSSDNIMERIFCADNYDKSPKCFIEGNYDLQKAGSYNVLFKASDSFDNVSTEDLVINVISNKVTKEVTSTNYDDIYTRFKNKNTLVGIDISYYQGNVDFEKLKDKIDFVFLRVGYGKDRNNKYVLDNKFKEYITNFNKLKIPVGIYFFSYDESNKDALDSASWVLKQIKKYKVDLPIVYDWENFSNFNDYKLSLFGLNDMAHTFIKKVESKGYNGMLYSSKNYLKYAWNDDYNVWIAHYNENENYESIYKLWQICDDGKIDGIGGNIDIDIMYK